MSGRPRVGVFQAMWPLQSQVTNGIRQLLTRGYDVDLFLYRVAQEFETLGGIDQTGVPNLRVIDLSDYARDSEGGKRGNAGFSLLKEAVKRVLRSQPGVYGTIERVEGERQKLMRSLRKSIHLNDADLLPRHLFEQTRLHMAGRHYRCLVGIERCGLVWAGHMASGVGTRLVYWSLELYTNDHPRFRHKKEFRMSKRLERRYHLRSDATIVQDSERADVLLRDNRIGKTRLLLVPVSVMGPPAPGKTTYIHGMLGIAPGKRVILAFGMMARWRLTLETVRAAQDFPDDWILVVHGPCEDAGYLRELSCSNVNGRARLSTGTIPQSEIGELAASADVGLVLYSNANYNDLLTGRSSEKAALYSRAGVPMVAFGYTSFKQVFDSYHCGRCISSFDEMIPAIEAILGGYDCYRAGALRAFQEVYEFPRQFSKVVAWLDDQR
jgi:hypothetical protein